jgi:hypothetical protein
MRKSEKKNSKNEKFQKQENFKMKMRKEEEIIINS